MPMVTKFALLSLFSKLNNEDHSDSSFEGFSSFKTTRCSASKKDGEEEGIVRRMSRSSSVSSSTASDSDCSTSNNNNSIRNNETQAMMTMMPFSYSSSSCFAPSSLRDNWIKKFEWQIHIQGSYLPTYLPYCIQTGRIQPWKSSQLLTTLSLFLSQDLYFEKKNQFIQTNTMFVCTYRTVYDCYFVLYCIYIYKKIHL